MLTTNPQALRTQEGIIVEMDSAPVDTLLEREWLLTNSRGGFSSGTVIGCNTRRYHGLLTGTLTPPANRIMALSFCHESVSVDGNEIILSNCEFPDHLAVQGMKTVSRFRRDIGVHWDYDLGVATLAKSLYLLPDNDTVALVYQFPFVQKSFDLRIRPLVGLRDFHALQKSQTRLVAVWKEDRWVVRTEAGYTGQLVLFGEPMEFVQDGQWWYNFHYRIERQRGQDCVEDLWSPGHYHARIDRPCQLIVWASLLAPEAEIRHDSYDLDTVIDALRLREKELVPENLAADPAAQRLCVAAGQLVTERRIQGRLSPTIVAGYPWFLDWGRDAMIALPGLLLCPRRFEEAAGVLTTFARFVSEGMVPNCFDDYGGNPHYNSIDASMWFVHACFEYLRVSKDHSTFESKLLPAIRNIIEAYRRGTRFGIHADGDGLITGGDAATQLTWMDAKCCGVTFTPRYGKAVEVNALWYHNLCHLADYYRGRNADEAEYFGHFAGRVAISFRQVFCNQKLGYLNDCILPDGSADSSLRPNQIYAVSLSHSPLASNWQQKVVDVVEKELLTPYGLRTLSPHDPRYRGRYEGDQMSRDGAYHQGTVWSHLMGPFIEAFLRVNHFDRISRIEAREFLQPLLDHLTGSGCLGSISEIFEGDEPHAPRGCFAQAWSVAEVLRAYCLVSK
ncbi:MAG: glycogen debranching protein [Phycisphaerae bacterium]|nr:glycogen debranching protein [Phycisphaerae bacterium]